MYRSSVPEFYQDLLLLLLLQEIKLLHGYKVDSDVVVFCKGTDVLILMIWTYLKLNTTNNWYLNPQTANASYMWFSRLFQFQPFFCYFLSLLERNTKVSKFLNKFFKKRAKFLPSSCTNLLLRSKPVQRNWLRFFKIIKKQGAL